MDFVIIAAGALIPITAASLFWASDRRTDSSAEVQQDSESAQAQDENVDPDATTVPLAIPQQDRVDVEPRSGTLLGS